MAVITTTIPPRFDPLNAYVRVRLAQGVPIVDADVNEREDIDMFEVRAFLKWFVGDGVPEGNDGFRIVESGLLASRTNNFTISSGFGAATDALTNAGRCLVNGLDVMIAADLDFRDQELFELLPSGAPKPNIAALEATRRSPRIRATDMDSGPAGPLHVWLDVWDALVTPTDVPALILPGLGTESCSREKRYFAVRVRSSATPPAMGDPEFAAGHSYYRIAEIARRGAADRNVNQGDITDRREQRLLVPPSTIIPDLFNTSVLEYRRGERRPVISFREAINALIRGEVPATTEANLTLTGPVSNNFTSRGTFFTPGSIVMVWTSNRAGGLQVFLGSFSRTNPGSTPVSGQQLTTTQAHQFPHGVSLLNGEVLVAYEETVAVNNEDAKLRCGPLTALLAQQDIAAGAGRQRRPFCVPIGATAASEQVVVMWHDTNAANRWRFRLYQPSLHNFSTAAADLSPTATTTQDMHAAKDSAGNIYIAFQVTNDIQIVELPAAGPTAGVPADVTQLSTGPTATPNVDKNPFVLVDRTNVAWVFWVSTTTPVPATSSIMYSRRDPVTFAWGAPVAIPGLPPGNYVSNAPVAVISDDGAIWVFWDSFLNTIPAGNKDIWYARLNPVSGVWSGSQPTTGTAAPDQDAVALSSGDGVIWLLWNRVLSGTNTDVFFRRLITTL